MKKIKGVLLIDDDRTTNFYNKFLLEKNGIAENIFVALNGEEGLTVLKENYETIKLILLDINMPIMNGFEFLEAYQKLEEKYKKNVVICLLTSSNHITDIEQSKKYPLKKYFLKPLEEDDLISTIKDLNL